MTQRKSGGQGNGMRSRNTTVRPRPGVASKELQEARRKKRQREVMRNRIIFGAGCAVILALIIFLIVKLIGTLLGAKASSDTSTLTFTDSGQVIFEEVSDFDSDTYSKTEFKNYAKELVDSFNETYGSTAITIDKIKVSGDKAYIKTTYKDADCYTSFTSYESYVGTYEEAVEAGYDFEELFSQVVDETKAAGAIVDADSLFAGQQVAIIKENVTVVVPGDIIYVSEPSTEIIDSSTVSISQADGNDDATDLVYIIY